MTQDIKESIRKHTGSTLIILVSIVMYILIPFWYIYSITVIISICLMITDLVQSDPKQGMIIYILKWTTLIPVINLVPLLIIPVFSIVNLFF